MTFSQPRSSTWWKVWGNLIGAIMVSEGEEAAWRESNAFEKVIAVTPKRKRPDPGTLANLAAITWDVPFQLQTLLSNLPEHHGYLLSPVAPSIADVYALLHDPERSARYMAMSDPNDESGGPAA